MAISQIEDPLRLLNASSPEILLSMVVSSDGLTLAHEGSVEDHEKVGALYIELQLICEKIMSELDYGGFEEMFVRSASGCVVIMPLFGQGILACMSTSDVNSRALQMATWKAVNQLRKIM